MVEFRYDGALQRTAMVADGTATYYVWDGLRLLETRSADGSLKARFTHGLAPIEGIGSCVEVYRASDSKLFYCLFDHRGSAWKLLDESKAVVATREYNAFGEIVFSTGTWPDEVPFGYQSNWMYLCDMPDGSPLWLSPTRVYHAGIGRYLQRDWLSYPNRYVCFTNCPPRMFDAWGLYSEDEAARSIAQSMGLEGRAARDFISRVVGEGGVEEVNRRGRMGEIRHEAVEATEARLKGTGRREPSGPRPRGVRRGIPTPMRPAVQKYSMTGDDSDLRKYWEEQGCACGHKDSDAAFREWKKRRIDPLLRPSGPDISRPFGGPSGAPYSYGDRPGEPIDPYGLPRRDIPQPISPAKESFLKVGYSIAAGILVVAAAKAIGCALLIKAAVAYSRGSTIYTISREAIRHTPPQRSGTEYVPPPEGMTEEEFLQLQKLLRDPYGLEPECDWEEGR